MGRKAGVPKARAKPKLSNKEQSERFKETARKLGVDESGRDFERAITKLIPPKKSSSA